LPRVSQGLQIGGTRMAGKRGYWMADERIEGYAVYGRRKVGFGARAALLVVDFQRGFTDARFPLGRSALVHRAVENTAELMLVAKRNSIPTVACAFSFGMHNPPSAHWKVDITTITEQAEQSELDHRISSLKPEFLLYKTAPSVFFGTPLASILMRSSIDTVIVTGCITSGCVRASVIDAFSFGLRVHVPEDCVGDHDLAAHEQNLIDVDRRYADVSDLAAVKAFVECAASSGENRSCNSHQGK
jgi:maleamate amidohydrolase